MTGDVQNKRGFLTRENRQDSSYCRKLIQRKRAAMQSENKYGQSQRGTSLLNTNTLKIYLCFNFKEIKCFFGSILCQLFHYECGWYETKIVCIHRENVCLSLFHVFLGNLFLLNGFPLYSCSLCIMNFEFLVAQRFSMEFCLECFFFFFFFLIVCFFFLSSFFGGGVCFLRQGFCV